MNRRRHYIAALSVVIGLSVGLSACGGSSGSSSSGDSKTAVVVKDFSNPFWVALRDGAQDQAKQSKGDVAVEGGANETDADGQNSKVSTLVTQGYSCFAVASVNSTNVITPLLAASKKGHPIISLDTPIDPEAADKAGLKLTSFIGSNNVEVGTTAGEEMVKLLGGKGEVVLLEGTPGAIPGIDRIDGFTEAVKGKLTIVQKQPADFEQNKGLETAEAMLKVHPNIKGIYAANDLMALGAAQAVENAGKTAQIAVIGNDGISAALDAVASGKMAGTVSQYPYVMGTMAVEACAALAKGEKIPEQIESPIKMITKENAAQAKESFPRPFFDYNDKLSDLTASDN